MSVKIGMTVNELPCERTVAENTLLSDLLRDELGLTGTHRGCDTAQCGACTVHVNGRAVKSCNVLAAQLNGCAVTTIEGLGSSDDMHPVQKAFRECHALQCGFCTPGMVMTAVDILRRIVAPTEEQVRRELKGNLCRCTGYENIVRAILLAASSQGNLTPSKAANA